jgi:hypothetical protein
LFRANILTLIKANLTKNFGLETKNQYIKSIEPTNFINSIGSINVTGFIGSIENITITKFIANTRIIDFFVVLEDITQQLLESTCPLNLGQLLKITLDLKQYIATKLALRKRTIIYVRI